MTRKESLLFIRFLKNINKYKEFNNKVINYIEKIELYPYKQKEMIKYNYPNLTVYLLETYGINSILMAFYKENYKYLYILYEWSVFKTDNKYCL